MPIATRGGVWRLTKIDVNNARATDVTPVDPEGQPIGPIIYSRYLPLAAPSRTQAMVLYNQSSETVRVWPNNPEQEDNNNRTHFFQMPPGDKLEVPAESKGIWINVDNDGTDKGDFIVHFFAQRN